MPEKEPFGFQQPPKTPSEITASLDLVDELVSRLLDDELSEEEFKELERRLQESPLARKQYVSMMQLHGDLIEHFRSKDVESGVQRLESKAS